MEAAKYLIVGIAGYLFGSINISISMSRHMERGDVRAHGSGNAGATNMARIYGMPAGVKVMLGDMLKAVAALLLGWFLIGDWGVALGGAAVMLGHCFPVFHDFRGGKGVSVGGVLGFAVDWRVGLLVVAGFLTGAFGTKKVSAGSVLGAVMITLGALLFHVSPPKLALAVFGMLVVLFQHRENIKRLINGTEPDFKPHKPLKKESKSERTK